MLIMMFCFSVSDLLAQESSYMGFKHAIVHSRFSDSKSGTGKATLFFDPFGAKKAMHTLIYSDTNTVRSESYELLIDHQYMVYNMVTRLTLECDSSVDVPTSSFSTTIYAEIEGLSYTVCGKYIVSPINSSNICNETESIGLWISWVMHVSVHLSMVFIPLEATDVELAQPPDLVFKQSVFKTTISNSLKEDSLRPLKNKSATTYSDIFYSNNN